MFDPYHRWLAIPRDQRPPTYYQLLGIAPDETEPEVIQEAALRQASHVRTYQTGPYAQQCQALLNEIGQARVTLLNPEKRKAYDDRLGKTAYPQQPHPGTETGDDQAAPETSVVAAPEADSLPFDFAAGRSSRRSRGGRRDHPALLALAYVILLLLGGMLAFWLAFSRP